MSPPVLLRWRAAVALRWYVRWWPIDVGKGFVSNHLLAPLLPQPPAAFDAELPTGDRVRLQYRERIGLSWLLHGGFERFEIEFAISAAGGGTTAVDVGAHAGLYTTALGRAVGPRGTVLAFEPSPDNLSRLRDNLERNGIENVKIHAAAATAVKKQVRLRIATDPAYGSTREVFEGRDSGEFIVVSGVPLDSAWVGAGRPSVSFVKIDVEGTELDVLSGAEELLRVCRPRVVIEAASDAARDALDEWFATRGFRRREVRGFMPWNKLYEPA
jgi:FkbM family methyltransferase